MRIRWTKTATRDLSAIEAYIEVDDPAAAARVALQLIDLVGHLAEHPHLGRTGRIAGTRELFAAGLPYVIPYRVRGHVLEVLRVLHGSMRWPDTL